jgi:hypothetical protein
MKKILKEIKSVARTAAYFAIVFMLMMLMKKLYLADYNIEFTGLSIALMGALILSKVVLLMELIPLGHALEQKPAIVDVLVRTLLYTVGVLIVVVLEKAFEDRHKAGGFGKGIQYVLNHRDIYHVWAQIIGCASALFVYNCFSIIQRALGKNTLRKIFFITPRNQVHRIADKNNPVTANN